MARSSKLPLRDRILRFERLPARELLDHTGNWRVHPQFQQDALAGVLREVGIVGALLVYQSPAAGGHYVTIDGHLRKAIAPDQTWPCLVLDVDDAEAAYILATYDPLSALADVGREELRSLLEQVQSGEAVVQILLHQLAEGASDLTIAGFQDIPDASRDASVWNKMHSDPHWRKFEFGEIRCLVSTEAHDALASRLAEVENVSTLLEAIILYGLTYADC